MPHRDAELIGHHELRLRGRGQEEDDGKAGEQLHDNLRGTGARVRVASRLYKDLPLGPGCVYSRLWPRSRRNLCFARRSEMAEKKLVGQNYSTADLRAKVTGRARYAEDFRAQGMLFARLLLSPYPHARVKSIDTSAALAMPGVKAILTADDVPGPKDQVNDAGQLIRANPKSEKALTNEPLYQGEPVLAVAAVDELTAAEAIEKIEIQWEPLPFSVDPVASLLPGAMNARVEGNVWVRPAPTPGQPPPLPEVQDLKWTQAEVDEYKAGRLPMGKDTDAPWSYGDIEAGFKKASLILDETFVTPNTSHQCLESRTSMAYWQNGKLFIHLSTQSAVQTVMSVARWLSLEPENVVLISEVPAAAVMGARGRGRSRTSSRRSCPRRRARRCRCASVARKSTALAARVPPSTAG